MVLVSVRCRCGRSRASPLSNGAPSASRLRKVTGSRIRTQAAASSIASGRPSTKRQISITAGRTVFAQDEPAVDLPRLLGEELHGRMLLHDYRWTTGAGKGSIRTSCSPRSRNGTRLVTSTVTASVSPTNRCTIAATASMTCSQLSRISSSDRCCKRKIERVFRTQERIVDLQRRSNRGNRPARHRARPRDRRNAPHPARHRTVAAQARAPDSSFRPPRAEQRHQPRSPLAQQLVELVQLHAPGRTA